MINYARQEEIEGGKGQKGTEGEKSQQKGDHIDKAPASPWPDSPVVPACLYNRKRYKYFKSNRRWYKLSVHLLFIKAKGCTCTFTSLDACWGQMLWWYICLLICVCTRKTLYEENVFHIKPGTQSKAFCPLFLFNPSAVIFIDICSAPVLPDACIWGCTWLLYKHFNLDQTFQTWEKHWSWILHC